MESIFLLFLAFISSGMGGMIRIPLKRAEVNYDQSGIVKRNNLLQNQLGPFNMYYGESNFAIGTPAQSFSFAFTTLHQHTYVSSSKCNKPQCGHRKRYNASLSTTSKTIIPWLILTLFGQFTAIATEDDVMLLGMNMTSHIIMNVIDWPTFYTNATYDGEIGLWPSNSIFTTIMDSKLLNRNVFSMYANKDDTAEIIFGDSDRNHYSGEMIYFTVPQRIMGTWNIGLDSLSDGNEVIYRNCTVYIWIGYNNIMSSKQVIEKWMSIINATIHENQYKVPCDKVDDLPPFVLTGQREKYSIPAKDYVIQDKDASGFCSLRFQEYGSAWLSDCSMSIGNLWLNNYYMEFDFEKMRVGLAHIK